MSGGTLGWRERDASREARRLLCISRASTLFLSSYRLHEYHEVPCSLHGPREKLVSSVDEYRTKRKSVLTYFCNELNILNKS